MDCTDFCGESYQKYTKFCMRCGKILKNSESQQCGYGKTCYKKIRTNVRKRLFNPEKENKKGT